MSSNPATKLLLISDFSINPLANLLRKEASHVGFKINIAPFNQVHQVLVADQLDCWLDHPDIAIVWTLPERILPSFQAYYRNEKWDLQTLLEEVSDFANLLSFAARRVSHLLVASWTVDSTLQQKEVNAFQPNEGISDILAQMNRTLSLSLSTTQNCKVVDSSVWLTAGGSQAYNPKLWYLSKTPFHLNVFSAAAKSLSSHISNLKVNFRKLIVCDLDNTIWGGVVGDIGFEQLILGGHHPAGEAFCDFQQALKSLSNAGVVLAIASKNEEKTALYAIEHHAEMILKPSDFVTWRINWEDKAKNIFEIAQELNLGLDAIVFLDDNPFERERVRHALPEVLVPDLPTDPMLYPHFLQELNCFQIHSVSEEDRRRTALYAAEKDRKQDANNFTDLNEWLKSIALQVKYEALNASNFSRVLQLLNKTNQLNLQTHRYTEDELWQRMSDPTFLSFAFSVKDNFGDAGLTGVLTIHQKGEEMFLVDFVVSCRVIGRKVEETMLSLAMQWARQRNCIRFIADYIASDKNAPTLQFFISSALEQHNFRFSTLLENIIEVPDCVQVSSVS